jgi:hypothetical protein
MTEEHTSGGKEFCFVIAVSALLYIMCATMVSLFNDYAFIGGIISVLIFCVYGYFVLTHYTSRFTYSLKNGRLRINRMIGKRNKEFEFACTDITRAYYGLKPQSFAKPVYNMRVSILSAKKTLYIEYKNSAGKLTTVAVEPSEKMRRHIEKERNK